MPSEESYKVIEGDWKDFRFRRVQPSDHDAIAEHIAEHFSRDEPTSKLLGWSQEFADDLNRVIKVFLKHDMSFLVEHKPTGKLAAIRVTFHHHPAVSFDGIPLNSRSGQLIVKLVDEVEEMADIKTKYGIDEWAEHFVASTSREFREMGLVGEMYERSTAFLKAEGHRHVLVVISSPHTKRAVEKRGFVELARLNYTDFNDFDGKPAFKPEDLTPDHMALVMVKTL